MPEPNEPYIAPRRRQQPRGPVATIGGIHTSPGWFWAFCAAYGCHHSRPIAIAPFRIRYGADASSDMIRRNLVCSKCGHRGATLSHPGWTNSITGYPSMPAEGTY